MSDMNFAHLLSEELKDSMLASEHKLNTKRHEIYDATDEFNCLLITLRKFCSHYFSAYYSNFANRFSTDFHTVERKNKSATRLLRKLPRDWHFSFLEWAEILFALTAPQVRVLTFSVKNSSEQVFDYEEIKLDRFNYREFDVVSLLIKSCKDRETFISFIRQLNNLNDCFIIPLKSEMQDILTDLENEELSKDSFFVLGVCGDKMCSIVEKSFVENFSPHMPLELLLSVNFTTEFLGGQDFFKGGSSSKFFTAMQEHLMS